MGIQLTYITNSLSSWLATGKIFAGTLASKGEGMGKPPPMHLRFRGNTLQRSCSLGKRADVPLPDNPPEASFEEKTMQTSHSSRLDCLIYVRYLNFTPDVL